MILRKATGLYGIMHLVLRWFNTFLREKLLKARGTAYNILSKACLRTKIVNCVKIALAQLQIFAFLRSCVNSFH